MPRVEEILWQEARCDNVWRPADRLEMKPSEVATIGYVISETVMVVCLASSWNVKSDEYTGITYIPVCSIRARTLLKEVED